MNEGQAKIYLVKYPSSLDDRTVVELARGIEPPTCGLQNHCSAIELRQPELIFCGVVTLLGFGILVKCSGRVLLEILAESRRGLS